LFGDNIFPDKPDERKPKVSTFGSGGAMPDAIP
jgi:hypothetical protein